MASTKGRSNHSWGLGLRPNEDEFTITCDHCALTEREIWLLDDQGRPVKGLVWLRPNGSAVAIRPFAHSRRRQPQNRPTRQWANEYPSVPVSGTPQCPKSPVGWNSS